MEEGATVIAVDPGSSFGAISDIVHDAYAINPEARRSRVPHGSAAFAWEAQWLTEACAAWGTGGDRRLRDALDHAPAHSRLFLADDGPIQHELTRSALLHARVVFTDLRPWRIVPRSFLAPGATRSGMPHSGNYRGRLSLGASSTDASRLRHPAGRRFDGHGG